MVGHDSPGSQGSICFPATLCVTELSETDAAPVTQGPGCVKLWCLSCDLT